MDEQTDHEVCDYDVWAWSPALNRCALRMIWQMIPSFISTTLHGVEMCGQRNRVVVIARLKMLQDV